MQSRLRVRQNGTGGADDGRLDYIAAVVLDFDMTMRFGAVRLLAFELLLPPTRFSTRFVSASELIAFVDLVWSSATISGRQGLEFHVLSRLSHKGGWAGRLRVIRPPPRKL